MRIQVLGPVRAWRDGDELDLRPAGQRAVLALLALACGQPLRRAELVDALWGEQPPPSAANVIQTHVKRLRRLLEPHRPPRGPGTVLATVGDGYALRVPTDAVDLAQFRRLVAAAAERWRDGDESGAAGLLGRALRLWQGAPLADVTTLSGHPKVVALHDERRAALARYGEALLAAGSVGEAIPVLAEAAAAQPLDEAAQARLIRAYHAAGQRAQAFATYHDIRRRLADELGVDPGVDLTSAHAAVLGDPRAPVRAAPATAPVPAQLPADSATFAGRVAELRRLDKIAARDGRHPAVVTISGTAGVGKTALAVRWAYRVRDRFPDGQLYVNLRGYDPAGAALTPAEVVRGFLAAFEVPAARLPAGLHAQVGLYRSLLAGRRVLVVLDNAASADQVRPLLPGGASMTVVTSRNRLTSLVAVDGADPLTVDLMSTVEARQLLAGRLGVPRLAADPAAADEIVARCARLPLALAIVAARAATHPEFPLRALAAELRDADGGLDAFAGEDAASDVRAVFSWSYRTLGPAAAALFRALAGHPGPDVSVPAAASLAGRPAGQTGRLLAELARAHLLTEHVPGRFGCHDLLRAYAAELAGTQDSARRRRAARHRVLDHYLHTAHAGAMRLNPVRDPIPLPAARPGVTAEPLADHDRAVAWFTAERDTLLSAVRQAAADRFDAHAWQLPWTMVNFIHRRGEWHDLAATQHTALAAARRLGDREAQALVQRYLAIAHSELGDLDEATGCLRQAIELHSALGDPLREAHDRIELGRVYERQGRHTEALDEAGLALELYRVAGHRPGQAGALNALGWDHALLGRYPQALHLCQQALHLHQATGDRHGQAASWDSIGYAQHHLGRHREAVDCHRRSRDLFREVADRYGEADALTHLGEAHQGGGDLDAARAAWRDALDILDELDHPDADQVRARLAGLDGAVRPPRPAG